MVGTSVLLAPAPQPVAPPVAPVPLDDDEDCAEGETPPPIAFVPPFTMFGGHVQWLPAPPAVACDTSHESTTWRVAFLWSKWIFGDHDQLDKNNYIKINSF